MVRKIVTGVSALFLTACTSGHAAHGAHDEGVRQVAVAGAQVMPFDLERSTHTFADTAYGGEQGVVSDDGDGAQIVLIRRHLSDEAARFARGEFGAPERIHGRAMPGLDVLRANYSALQVTYADIPNGGGISYRARDAEMIDAIHAWFAAQRSDHGAHAAH